MPFEIIIPILLLLIPLAAISLFLNRLFVQRLGNELGRQMDHRGISVDKPSDVQAALARIEQRLERLEVQVGNLESRDQRT